jgi:hypothetical protein
MARFAWMASAGAQVIQKGREIMTGRLSCLRPSNKEDQTTKISKPVISQLRPLKGKSLLQASPSQKTTKKSVLSRLKA